MVASPATESAAKSSPAATSLRAIIAYKLLRGSATGALALFAILSIVTGTGERGMLHFAEFCRVHVGHGLGAHLAQWVAAAATPRHLHEIAAALSVDSTWTLFEAWALKRGYAWAEWLVVAATALLLPFEAYAIAQQPSLARVLVLLGNVAIVAVLARRIWLERQRH
ncbi:MAG TPA: DUF2127 domain-containing protein [Polyangiales bacterium]|nr:DUF2127 domain-containing protein [Polyangiales bacterium]